jgi:hypothetical protein
MLVVASQSGHELLRVIVLDVGDEKVSGSPAQRRRMATVVTDHHFVADDSVREAGGWVDHDKQHAIKDAVSSAT